MIPPFPLEHTTTRRGVCVIRVLLSLLCLLSLLGCHSVHEEQSAERLLPITHQREVTRPIPFILRADGKEWILDLRRMGYDGVDPTTLDRDAFDRWLRPIERELYRPPRSAHFRNRVLQPHQTGRKVDRQAIEEWLDVIHAYIGRPMEVPFIPLKPSITTSDLKGIRQKLLGTYTTRFNPGNINRTHNILLSTKAIDHVVVGSGEVFSFNKTVGPRTRQRGYRPAPVIVRGEYSEGIGGGICQTSSTLFNSVDQAGLRIIQRVSHSKEVTYVPPGRDATVSWGGPDFQFQNQLDRPSLLVASARGGWLTVSVYSSADIQHRKRSVPAPPEEEPDTQRTRPDEPNARLGNP
jgi:vancomycin resistance protein YoaR